MSHRVWVAACALASEIKGGDCVGRGFQGVKLTPLHFLCQCCTRKEAGTFPRDQVSLSLAGLPATFMSGSASTVSHLLCTSHYPRHLAALHTDRPVKTPGDRIRGCKRANSRGRVSKPFWLEVNVKVSIILSVIIRHCTGNLRHFGCTQKLEWYLWWMYF